MNLSVSRGTHRLGSNLNMAYIAPQDFIVINSCKINIKVHPGSEGLKPPPDLSTGMESITVYIFVAFYWQKSMLSPILAGSILRTCFWYTLYYQVNGIEISTLMRDWQGIY